MPEQDVVQDMIDRIMEEGKMPAKEMLTKEQNLRMESVALAMGCLQEAQTSYLFLASPDSPKEGMKVIQSNRLSYATDLDAITKETPLARQAFLMAALKSLSIGLKGGIVLVDEKQAPLCMFNDGKVGLFDKARTTS